ncbi:hypothetical protein [Microbulbifer hydrolyticus]|uniref:Redoxin domain-containing protein n=1 Tax=Microbulbifer hydrolyticus TaxID=48074 RepID=A0A6P1T993_9GAMM|nr:hypothetical protein [Microbulbifer hydrolyticus]MBB5212909.1 hypothetical protein [Microbulbifer hydrolyticus]QHQ38305.1 hypothetical protein GTQ55_04400 [Microbulbifer hydrolyticus]
MNKFKVFFTFIGFFWLLLCGFGAIYAIATGYGSNSPTAWLGLLINAWALPIWMLVRYLYPGKIAGDLREPGAFSGVLMGLAIVLLADNERGLPVYLAIANLFVLLAYLYHLSAVRHPKMPALDTEFPPLEIEGSENWRAAAFCRERRLDGVLLVFLRGSYCADSRSQLHQIRALLPDLTRRNIGLLLLSTQPELKWPAPYATDPSVFVGGNVGVGNTAGRIPSGAEKYREDSQLRQLDVSGEASSSFVARSAAPFILRPWVRDAARPSAWLIDREGYILWRELAANYREPASVELLRSQLFRVED